MLRAGRRIPFCHRHPGLRGLDAASGCCARPHFAWTAERADDWRRPWPGFAGTRYEAKAKREGRLPCYLIFRKTDDRGRATHHAPALQGEPRNTPSLKNTRNGSSQPPLTLATRY